MNCLECQQRIHDRLDGLPPSNAESVLRHLTTCPSCRDVHASAVSLELGLRRVTPPTLPPDLTSRIVSAVLDERHRRGTRLRLIVRTAVAVAAGLLLMILAGDRLPREMPDLVTTISGPPVPEAVVVVSLRDSVAEAGTLVSSLGRRTSDEAVGQGRTLLDVVAVSPVSNMSLPPLPVEPPVHSLATAGEAIGVGLEPVTTSARRAFGLFFGSVPLDQPEAKPGL